MNFRVNTLGVFSKVMLIVIILAYSNVVNASAFLSDDFNSTTLEENPVWRFYDPYNLDNDSDNAESNEANESTLLLDGTNAVISIPSGISHDLWVTNNTAPRLLQSASNTDFGIELKVETTPGQVNTQLQGIIVQQADDVFLRFDIFSTPSPKIFVAYVNGSTHQIHQAPIALPHYPKYRRVIRSGDEWTFRYSDDGTTWTDAVTFTQSLSVTEVGFFAGTAGSNPSFLSSVDYFMDVDAPLVDNDTWVADPPVINAWYGGVQPFGEQGITQKWANILGNVFSHVGLSSLTYKINGGSELVSPLGPNSNRLERKGDFNIEIDYDTLSSGSNSVEITATDVSGLVATDVVIIDYHPGNIWPLSYTADWGSLTSIENIESIAHVVDGLWKLSPEGIRTDQKGYDRAIALGDMNWSSDYEVTVPMTFHSGFAGVGFGVGWQGHTGVKSPRIEWPLQALAWVRGPIYNASLEIVTYGGLPPGPNTWEVVKATQAVSVAKNIPYMLKTASEPLGNGTSRFNVKFWPQSEPEPVDWNINSEVPTRDGSVLLVAYKGDVTFGNVIVNPLVSLPPDNISPVISHIQVNSLTHSTVIITWETDEPSNSLINYGLDNLYGVSENDATQLTSHNLVLNNLAENTEYHYQIKSIDSQNNAISSEDLVFTTPFTDRIPPVISHIQVSALTHSTAAITWETNEASTSAVDYGLDSSYGTLVDETGNVVSHHLTLTNLQPNTGYHYQLISTDGSDNTASSEDLTFTTNALPTSPSGMVSDDFNGDLNANVWGFYDPIGDSSLSTTGLEASIAVPAGSSHDLWGNKLFAPRIRQAANNTDFEIEAKFVSPLSMKYQMQGFTVEQDASNLVRFDFYNDGSVTRVFSASFVNGQPSVRFHSIITDGNPLYLRIVRNGDQWTMSYSYEGTQWLVAGSFVHTLNVSSVAIFGGNAGHTPPEHTTVIDYFKVDGVAPVIVGTDTQAPLISNSQVAVTETTATITWGTDEVSDSQVSYGTGIGYGLNASAGANVVVHSLTLVDLLPGTEYHYQIHSTDPSGNLASSMDKTFTTVATALDTTPPVISNIQTTVTDSTATIIWATDEPSNSVVDYGLSNNYGINANDSIQTTTHSLVLTGLNPNTLYHYQIKSSDSSSNVANSTDLEFTTSTITTPSDGWWNNNWNYRASLTVNSGNHARFEKPVETSINFTDYLVTADQVTPFDENSMRVHEVNASGAVITENIPFQFDPAIDFNATTKAKGNLIFLLSGNTTSQANRYFQIYFDVEGGGYTASVFTDQVNVTDNIMDEGQSSFKIETDNASYFYQKQAGGFSSIVDNNGNDWIGYHPAVTGVSGAAGVYRGLPNLVFPEGYFHPGSTDATSTVLQDGPLKATVQSVTNDGKWKVQWEFFPTFSRMTVTQADKNFWFLYEGTPGGTLDVSDFVMRSNGVQNLVTESWTGDISNQEWVYFADPNVNSGRSLFVAHHNDDNAVDSYFPLDAATDLQMTVFGFGRKGTNSSIDKNQTHQFTLGLTDSTDFSSTSGTIESAYNAIATTITANAQNPGNTGSDTTAPVVSNIQTVVTDTTATITWTTDEASSGKVNYGLDNTYGSNAEDSNTVLGTAHSVILNGLTAGTEYHFEVVSTDASSNNSTPVDQVLTTIATVDSVSPIMSNRVVTVTETTATVTWDTNEPSNSVVNYGLDSSYSEIPVSHADLVTTHSLTFGGLNANTEYHYEVSSTDASNNNALSGDLTFTTATVTAPIVETHLVAHWLLDAGSGVIASDKTGHGYNGTLINGAAWNGNKVFFDGVNDYINAGTLDVEGEALTLTGWIQAVNLANCTYRDCRILSKATGTATQDHYWMISTIKVGSETRLRFRLKAGGSTSTLVSTSGNLVNGELFHVAATYDGHTMRLYKDGVEVGRLAKTGAIDTNNTTELWIGANPTVASARPWQGSISDVRVYKKALTVVDVNAVKNSEPLVADTTAPIMSNRVVTVTDTMATITWETNEASNSVLNYGLDNSYSEIPVSHADLVTVHSLIFGGLNANTEYHYELSSTDASNNNALSGDLTFTTATASTTTPIVDTNLVAHWSLDVGSGVIASDKTGNGHDGTLINGVTWNGTELIFDGVNDYVNLGTLDVSGSALTLTGWVQATDLANCTYYDCRILSKASGASEQDHYWMISTTKVGSVTRLRFRLKAGGLTSTLIATSGDISNGDSFHVATTYDGETMRLYKDGVEVGSRAKTGAIDTNSTVEAWIGGNPTEGSSRPWDGSLTNVRVYQKSLTPTEVITIMNTDKVADVTAPIISNEQVTTTSSSATISWNTNEAADSNVSYGTSDAYENGIISDGSSVVSHSVTLSGLAEATTYHYQLESTDSSGNTATSIDLTFVTGAVGDQPELIMFDWNTLVTKSYRGFPRDKNIDLSINGDWTETYNPPTNSDKKSKHSYSKLVTICKKLES